MSLPFTAARARNAGFRRLRKSRPILPTCNSWTATASWIDGWPECALSFLDAHADVGAVCGRRRERYPEQSIYNWLCDREWDGPVGRSARAAAAT